MQVDHCQRRRHTVTTPLPDVDVYCSGMGLGIADNGLRNACNAGLKKIQEWGKFDKNSGILRTTPGADLHDEH